VLVDAHARDLSCDDDKLFSPEQALSYALHVCSAVQHLHGTQRVHTDIKPSNLLLAPVGDAASPTACPGADADKALLKLGDMGVAALVIGGDLRQIAGYSRHVPRWLNTRPFASDAFAIAWVLLDMLSLTNDTDMDARPMSDDAAFNTLLANRKARVGDFYSDQREVLLPLLDAAICTDLHRAPDADAKRSASPLSVTTLYKQIDSALQAIQHTRKGGL
jgi:serine/threonine protein kinase